MGFTNGQAELTVPQLLLLQAARCEPGCCELQNSAPDASSSVMLNDGRRSPTAPIKCGGGPVAGAVRGAGAIGRPWAASRAMLARLEVRLMAAGHRRDESVRDAVP